MLGLSLSGEPVQPHRDQLRTARAMDDVTETVPPTDARERVAVFASYSGDGFLPPQVLPYLEGLVPMTRAIVVVCDNDLHPEELAKLSSIATHVITGRHGEYDFGSYKRGVAWARDAGYLDTADDLILCNDSCYGPVGSFAPMFETMEQRGLDFWGVTDNEEFSYHLQSYWVVLSRPVFLSDAFEAFMASIKSQKNVQDVILAYELGLTDTLRKAGFSVGALVKNSLRGVHPDDPTYRNLTILPIYCIDQGSPLIKVKALKSAHINLDGQNRLLALLKKRDATLYNVATSDIAVKAFEDAGEIGFSLVMPTKNRAWCISNAIDSVLGQTHENFELIIVDDGSTDNTQELIQEKYAREIKCGLLKYVKLPESRGVSIARNLGVLHAKFPWIGYVDSDNSVRSYFLTVLANAIVQNPREQSFYGRIINKKKGSAIGEPFSLHDLRENNFIDLGAFIHKKSLVYSFGGFDPTLNRLVDWDLILRYSVARDPFFLRRIFVDYSDDDDIDRISTRESVVSSRVAIHKKHNIKTTVTTAILCYNHQEYIAEAIESALSQTGNMTSEILISDDGSTDGTKRIISYYAKKYPKRIRNISRGANFGITDNYRHCFSEAKGTYISILEGDDYWCDQEKAAKQAHFLEATPEAVMVFSRIEAFDTLRNTRRNLARQEDLPRLLQGDHFARNEHLNLIANFSSAMFRTDVMRRIPSAVFIPRINEIALAFYLERHGKIGFLDTVMSVYRQNPTSVWTGAGRTGQLAQAIEIRKNALRICRPQYRGAIQDALARKEEELRLFRAQEEVETVA